jgi:hypothetical protein
LTNEKALKTAKKDYLADKTKEEMDKLVYG